MANWLNVRCEICFSNKAPNEQPWVQCKKGHFTCSECFSNYIIHTWSERDFGIGILPELRCCVNECTSEPFSAQEVAKHASREAWEAYDAVRTKAKEGILLAKIQKRTREQSASDSAESESKKRQKKEEETQNIILGEQLRRQLPNARMCPRCKCGPIDHKGCSNLATHHGDIHGSTRISNECPNCKYFSHTIDAWPRWDGVVRSGQQLKPGERWPPMPAPSHSSEYNMNRHFRQRHAMSMRTCTVPTSEFVLYPPPPPPPTIFEPDILRLVDIEDERLVQRARQTHGTRERFNAIDSTRSNAINSTRRISLRPPSHTINPVPIASEDQVSAMNGISTFFAFTSSLATRANECRNSWRFSQTGNDLLCLRQNVRLRLWNQSNGWFDVRQGSEEFTITASLIDENYVIPRDERAPLTTGSVQFPERHGNWRLALNGSNIEIRHTNQLEFVLILSEEGYQLLRWSNIGSARSTGNLRASATNRLSALSASLLHQ